MKKTLALFLALLMCLALCPVASAAEYTVTEVVPCKYEAHNNFCEGLAQVVLNGKNGFIDMTGKEVIPCKYDDTGNFSEGLAAIMLNGKEGFIDTTGREVVPCQYAVAWPFKEGFAAVARHKYGSLSSTLQWGFIDTTGKEVIPCKYTSVKKFSEGFASVETDYSGWGFVDATGKETLGSHWGEISSFNGGFALVKDSKLNMKRLIEDNEEEYIPECVCIDVTGREVWSLEYAIPRGEFSDGLAPVQKCETYDNIGTSNYFRATGKFGYFDTTGREVIPCKYDSAQGFSEGLAVVELNDKYGFVDTTGREVVPCKYDRAFDFSEGLAKVELDGKYGYVDATGKEVISCKYSSESNFSGGRAVVTINGEHYIIDTTGKESAIPALSKYDSVSYHTSSLPDGLLWVWQNGKCGLVSIVNASTVGTTDTANIAYPSTQTVNIDGKAVEFQMYALKDANGNDTNYVKVRDLALVLNGTKAQFGVDWNGAVNLVVGAAYSPNGSENSTPFSGERTYSVPTDPTNVNGSASDLAAIVLNDDNGGGYTYYKLRDLGAALGFTVDWSSEKGVFIETEASVHADPFDTSSLKLKSVSARLYKSSSFPQIDLSFDKTGSVPIVLDKTLVYGGYEFTYCLDTDFTTLSENKNYAFSYEHSGKIASADTLREYGSGYTYFTANGVKYKLSFVKKGKDSKDFTYSITKLD